MERSQNITQEKIGWQLDNIIEIMQQYLLGGMENMKHIQCKYHTQKLSIIPKVTMKYNKEERIDIGYRIYVSE